MKKKQSKYQVCATLIIGFETEQLKFVGKSDLKNCMHLLSVKSLPINNETCNRFQINHSVRVCVFKFVTWNFYSHVYLTKGFQTNTHLKAVSSTYYPRMCY